jgi:transposase
MLDGLSQGNGIKRYLDFKQEETMIWLKRKKVSKVATEQFYKYLKIEQNDKRTEMTADITDEDIKKWLYGVAQMIQTVFNRHDAIKNYLTGQIWLGGQQIEFALVKDFKEGPHACD